MRLGEIDLELIPRNFSFLSMQHHVYFWVKEECKTTEGIESFEAGLQSLMEIPSVVQGSFGTPAATEERGPVDNSWDYALIINFEDVKGHDEYQVHPIHDDFVAKFKDIWSQVRVSDVQF